MKEPKREDMTAGAGGNWSHSIYTPEAESNNECYCSAPFHSVQDSSRRMMLTTLTMSLLVGLQCSCMGMDSVGLRHGSCVSAAPGVWNRSSEGKSVGI